MLLVKVPARAGSPNVSRTVGRQNVGVIWESIARPSDSKNAISYIKEMLAFVSGNLRAIRRGAARTTFLGIVRDLIAVIGTFQNIAADLRQLSSKPPTAESEQAKKMQAEIVRIVTQTAYLPTAANALLGVGIAGVSSSKYLWTS